MCKCDQTSKRLGELSRKNPFWPCFCRCHVWKSCCCPSLNFRFSFFRKRLSIGRVELEKSLANKWLFENKSYSIMRRSSTRFADKVYLIILLTCCWSSPEDNDNNSKVKSICSRAIPQARALFWNADDWKISNEIQFGSNFINVIRCGMMS